MTCRPLSSVVGGSDGRLGDSTNMNKRNVLVMFLGNRLEQEVEPPVGNPVESCIAKSFPVKPRRRIPKVVIASVVDVDG